MKNTSQEQKDQIDGKGEKIQLSPREEQTPTGWDLEDHHGGPHEGQKLAIFQTY